MARIRTIKPEFFTSADVTSMTPLARLLFIGLWGIADREGRMKWRPADFKLQILPGDNCDINELCGEIVDGGMVVLYGDGLAYIPSFLDHQSINPRETISKLPSPDAIPTRAHASNLDVHVQRGREGKGKEEQSIDCLPAESGKAKRKSKLPDDFEATEERLDYAKAQGCADPADTFTRFKLHHQSKGTLALDWEKGWQYWCRNESNFRRPQAGKFARTEGLPTSRDDDSQWRARVRSWRPGRFWNRGDWGPDPTEPGCRAPASVLSEWRSEAMQ